MNNLLWESQFTQNLHLLLWSVEPNKREKWASVLATWIKGEDHRSKALIRGAKPSEEELRKIGHSCSREPEQILFGQLVSPGETLARNIDHLFEGLDHGSKGEFAKLLEVDISTISRWRRGLAKPSPNHIKSLQMKFMLPSDVNLETDPLYVSPIPLAFAHRKHWLIHQINNISNEYLNRIFPALQILLD